MLKHRKARPNYCSLMTTSWYSKSLSGYYRKFGILKVEIKCEHSTCKHTCTHRNRDNFFLYKNDSNFDCDVRSLKNNQSKKIYRIDFKSKCSLPIFFHKSSKVNLFPKRELLSLNSVQQYYPNITCNHRRGCATTYRKVLLFISWYVALCIYIISFNFPTFILCIDNLDW